jgi:hypothetical protein
MGNCSCCAMPLLLLTYMLIIRIHRQACTAPLGILTRCVFLLLLLLLAYNATISDM